MLRVIVRRGASSGPGSVAGECSYGHTGGSMVVEASKVRAIQAMLDQGKSVREIARELGVGGNTVLNVRRGLPERGVLKEEQEAAARDLVERGERAPEVAAMLEV